MSPARRSAVLCAALATGLALGGCISVLPKQKPAQLYRFDAAAVGAPYAPGSGDGVRVEVVAPPVVVSRASATDAVLTVTGSEAAFIAGARWVSPAAVLWDETVRRAFAARSGRVRLLGRGELAGGRAFLRLDVPEFEVRYLAPGSVPSVHVTLHALYAHRDGTFSAERSFVAVVPASEDRVSAIVAAFDGAVEKVVTEGLSWADAHADEAAATPTPSPTPMGAGVLQRSPGVRATSTTSTSSTRAITQRPRP